jgi:hypothetical protein
LEVQNNTRRYAEFVILNNKMEGRVQEIKDKVTAAKGTHRIVDYQSRELIEKRVEEILKMIEAASTAGKSRIWFDSTGYGIDQVAISVIANSFQVIPNQQESIMTGNMITIGWTIIW